MVAASGLTFGGIGAAFWALIAGLAVRAVLTAGRSGTAPGTAVGRAEAAEAVAGRPSG